MGKPMLKDRVLISCCSQAVRSYLTYTSTCLAISITAKLE